MFSRRRFSVFPSTDDNIEDDTKLLLHVATPWSFGTKMEATFTNTVDGQPVRIGLATKFSGTTSTIWVDLGDTGDKSNRKVVATLYKPFMGGKMYLTIAPGVDTLLVIVLCCLQIFMQDRVASPSISR